jgi:3-dehydroquinate synthase
MNTERITVGLGARSYEIIIGAGLLDGAGSLLARHLNRPFALVVTDQNVARAQGARLEAALASQGIRAETIALPPGEPTKDFAHLQFLLDRFAALALERSDLVLAFGGGVVGDLAGFAAAIFKRGCRFVQIPTTLLSQVDSAVGGKTAVNMKAGKNLAGAFHQPSLVISDVSTLKTLPQRELRSGYAEVVKCAALADAAFFGWLETSGAKIYEHDAGAVSHAVKTCCEIKVRIVERDETETGERALLNLGHTFGHALEAALGYSEGLLHGEAVAAGMGLAFDYAAQSGICPKADAERLKRHLRSAGLPAGLEDVAALPPPAALLDFMRSDKKAEGGRMTLILPRRIGEAFVARDTDESELLAFLEKRVAKKS